jgi:microcystin-dependent protein
MPPGINKVDTSLGFIGKGYPNYGKVIDDNFLKLLENFASPLPPENPIEGQLWYDTSNLDNKVLRIMDGTAGAVSWPSANGIYQQATNPAYSTTRLKNGDIWVDTTFNQINLYSSGQWVAVTEPRAGALNGAVNAVVNDTEGIPHYVTQHFVDGTIVSIVALEQFTPNPVIPGFGILSPGINVFGSGVVSGIAVGSNGLIVNGAWFDAKTFLRKDDYSNNQIITGRLTFSTPNINGQAGAQGRDGVLIKVTGSADSEYLQLYKYVNDAILLNNTAGGTIKFQTISVDGTTPNNTVVIAHKVLAINTSTSASSPTLDVYGNARILSTLTVLSTQSNAISVHGGITANGDLLISGTSEFLDDATVDGQLYINWLDTNGTPKAGPAILPSTTGIYDIGSNLKKFNRIYANSVGTTGTQYFGVFNGPATGLVYNSTFRMQGQVTATNFVFSGNGTTATYVTFLTPNAITDQKVVSTVTDTLTFMVADTSTSATYTGLQKISKYDLFSSMYLPGMIMPYGGNVVPAGWLACDGASYTVSQYPTLANALQNAQTGNFIYGGAVPNFNVPDLSTATPVTKQIGTNYLTYIIKT